VASPWRKPLVVMSPKSLLRHPQATSPLAELVEGRFQPIIPDEVAAPDETTRVVLCSGKLYYDLAAGRRAAASSHAALVRLEQLYPIAVEEVLAAIGRFRAGVELVWAQEEPENMGAWTAIQARLAPLLPGPLALVSRPPSASPAAGSATRHKLEQEQLVREALGEPVSRLARGGARVAQER
jgi:2-oxoglutarate dehydrogenase E1 component